MTPRELAARAERAAPEEQRDLLEALFVMINPPNVWHDGSGFAWRVEHFKALLNIGTDEAFTAAAMMLAPEGWQWGLYSPDRDAGETRCGFEMCPSHELFYAGGTGGAHAGYAVTPALAILAAVAKARSEPDNAKS